ncbi:MAG TPA: hypothetical protein PKZ35_00575, partial [Gammaproteobacteria bacterium]|nr:hypothetical protein [Gammaproteobacteria bacterium]
LRGQQFVDAFGQQPGVVLDHLLRASRYHWRVENGRRPITAAPGMSPATVGNGADLRVGSRLYG